MKKNLICHVCSGSGDSCYRCEGKGWYEVEELSLKEIRNMPAADVHEGVVQFFSNIGRERYRVLP